MSFGVVSFGGGRRRQLTIGAAIIVPAAAIALGVFVPRDSAREVEFDEVVGRFRASTVPSTVEPSAAQSSTHGPSTVAPDRDTPDGPESTESAPTAPPLATSPATVDATQPPAPPVALVEPGIYQYRTTGNEQIDALTGVTHEYPAETTITVVADGCGVLLRWDALKERREEWRLCATPAGIELQPHSLQYHEFFEQRTPEDVLCDRAAMLVPVSDGPLEPVALTCTIEDRPWLPVWEVQETGFRVIDGESIDVRHVRMTIDDNDEHFEHYVADWLLAPSGLPVELKVLKQSKSPSVVGDVVYDEVVELELVSTEPLR